MANNKRVEKQMKVQYTGEIRKSGIAYRKSHNFVKVKIVTVRNRKVKL